MLPAHPHTPITPIPFPEDDAPILLVGGSFDPPHRAHVQLAEAARDRLFPPSPTPSQGQSKGQSQGQARILFVPAARSPHKPDPPRAGAHHRAAMLELAIQDTPRAAVWTDEIDRASDDPDTPPSYWADTLQRLRTLVGPRPAVRFLIGDDQARAFHRWHRPRDILALAQPAVLLRAADAPALMDALRAAGAWSEPELEAWRSWIVPAQRIDASSTDARAALERNDTPAAAAILHPAVLAYIRARGLYEG